MIIKRICLIAGITVPILFAALFSSYAGKAGETTISPNRITGQSKAKSGGKVLVAYFTHPETDGTDASSGASRVISDGKLYGNTEYIARLIAGYTGGELFAVKTVKKYPGSHQALIEDAKREAEADERPALATHIENPDDYNVVFVGYPNWWYDMPMPIYSFFDEYDFSGKTVIPFCTHGGSRFSKSVETIAGIEKNARVLRGPSVWQGNVPDARESILKWLEEHGLTQQKKQ